MESQISQTLIGLNTIDMTIDIIMKGISWLQICVFLHFCAIHNWNPLPNMTDTSIGLNFPISNRSVPNLRSIRDSCHLVKQLRHGSISAVGRQADLCLRCLHLVYCSTNGMTDSLTIQEISRISNSNKHFA